MTKIIFEVCQHNSLPGYAHRYAKYTCNVREADLPLSCPIYQLAIITRTELGETASFGPLLINRYYTYNYDQGRIHMRSY